MAPRRRTDALQPPSPVRNYVHPSFAEQMAQLFAPGISAALRPSSAALTRPAGVTNEQVEMLGALGLVVSAPETASERRERVQRQRAEKRARRQAEARGPHGLRPGDRCWYMRTDGGGGGTDDRPNPTTPVQAVFRGMTPGGRALLTLVESTYRDEPSVGGQGGRRIHYTLILKDSTKVTASKVFPR